MSKKIISALTITTMVIAGLVGIAPFASAATFTAAEVAQHNTAADCYVIVNSSVYDVTELIPTHPGGAAVITAVCGQEATAAFTAGPHSNVSLLTPYLLGPLVTAHTLTSVTVSPAAPSIMSGGTVQLTALPVDENGNPISATVSWSSSDSGIASVNNSGLVTGNTAGTATITATAVSGAVTVTGTSQVTVTEAQEDPVLSGVTISPSQATISVGGTEMFTAAPVDQNGSQFIGATITFSSSNPSVASVNNNGLVTGNAVGTATITVTAVSGAITETATAEVTVVATTPPPPPPTDDDEDEDEEEDRDEDEDEDEEEDDDEDEEEDEDDDKKDKKKKDRENRKGNRHSNRR